MLDETPDTAEMIPVDQIEVLNSRDRNLKVFEEIVENIKAIGLKKPITVSRRNDDSEVSSPYILVCGEGRLNAFKVLGEAEIPALVIDVNEEDALIMSLAENIARRGYRPLEVLADIEALRKRGHSPKEIIRKTGLSSKYVYDVVFLIEKGEERLIEGVQRGRIPLTAALEIARAKDGDENLGDMLEEAYQSGQLKGKQLIEAKRLVEKRAKHGPGSREAEKRKPPTTSINLVRTYQREVERQRKMVLKADHTHQQFLLVVECLKSLITNPKFMDLLQAEGLTTLPQCLGDRLQIKQEEKTA